MGVSINMVQLPYAELKKKLMEHCVIKEKDKEGELDEILNKFGAISGDSYFILHNEYYEEYDAYFELPKFLDAFYRVSDTFDIILGLYSREDFNVNACDVAEEYGFDYEEDEDGNLTFSRAE